ncbi:MAG: hypothetical protein AUI36_15705 [Cyanobacteria bacterium 13_1_40CM_2_61_4]|nr:MAG: hypothetical protein AUI36_15705 [Cyanobacteria bacterium 13_1_40CM_2_61_4]
MLKFDPLALATGPAFTFEGGRCSIRLNIRKTKTVEVVPWLYFIIEKYRWMVGDIDFEKCQIGSTPKFAYLRG